MVALLNMSPRREPCIDLAIERTLRVAKRASHRAYLRVYLDTVDLCFLRYLELDTLVSEQAMAWADGKEDRSFVAIGVEAASPIYSTIRFARAGIHCLEVCEQSIEVELETGEFPAETMPVAVGGFSFAPRTESADGMVGATECFGSRPFCSSAMVRSGEFVSPKWSSQMTIAMN